MYNINNIMYYSCFITSHSEIGCFIEFFSSWQTLQIKLDISFLLIAGQMTCEFRWKCPQCFLLVIFKAKFTFLQSNLREFLELLKRLIFIHSRNLTLYGSALNVNVKILTALWTDWPFKKIFAYLLLLEIAVV